MRTFVLLAFVILFSSPIQGKRRRFTGKMTWYSRDDNDSKIGSKDNVLNVFRSVATNPDSRIPFGTKLYIPALRGLPMGKGHRHDGWVRVDDTCRGGPCQFLDLYVGSNSQRDFYRRWILSKYKTRDPDLLPIIAYM